MSHPYKIYPLPDAALRAQHPEWNPPMQGEHVVGITRCHDWPPELWLAQPERERLDAMMISADLNDEFAFQRKKYLR